ncbi:hypothetical protein [Mesorhizobium abyssinicae]
MIIIIDPARGRFGRLKGAMANVAIRRAMAGPAHGKFTDRRPEMEGRYRT